MAKLRGSLPYYILWNVKFFANLMNKNLKRPRGYVERTIFSTEFWKFIELMEDHSDLEPYYYRICNDCHDFYAIHLRWCPLMTARHHCGFVYWSMSYFDVVFKHMALWLPLNIRFGFGFEHSANVSMAKFENSYEFFFLLIFYVMHAHTHTCIPSTKRTSSIQFCIRLI